MSDKASKMNETDPKEINGFRNYFDWVPKEYLLPVNVFEEVTLGSRPLSREEFRKLCDQGKTRQEILDILTTGAKPRLLFWIVIGILVTAAGFVIAFSVLRRRRFH